MCALLSRLKDKARAPCLETKGKKVLDKCWEGYDFAREQFKLVQSAVPSEGVKDWGRGR